MPFELSWRPGGSVGFLINLFGFFELTMVVVRGREGGVLAWCCKANTKSNPPREATTAGAPCPHTFKCLNCRGDHAADDNKCPFWRHRFDKQWHANKAAEVRSGRANRSTINGPSGDSQ